MATNNSKRRAEVVAALAEATREGLNVCFLGLSRLVRRKLSQPGTGRIYRVARGKRRGRNLRARGFHRASAPGFPPAVNTNRLRSSFITDYLGEWKYGYAKITEKEGRMWLNYGSRVTYAPVLEYGDRRGRLKARPYLRPTFAVFRKGVERIFATAIRRRFGAST